MCKFLSMYVIRICDPYLGRKAAPHRSEMFSFGNRLNTDRGKYTMCACCELMPINTINQALGMSNIDCQIRE